MPKRRNKKIYADVKPWVMAAITEESRLRKGLLWKNEPTADDVYQERLRRVRFLRKHGKVNAQADKVANRLDACEVGNRCLSGACPECGRIFQRWFVRRSGAFIAQHLDCSGRELVAITIVSIKAITQPEHLNEFSIVDFLRRLKYALKKVGLVIALGAVDFSFNEDHDGKYESFWCPHIYLFAAVDDKKSMKECLRKLFGSNLSVPKPVKIKTFANSTYGISYALKMKFKRRIGYDEIKIEKDGNIRKCRNTSRDKLRAEERLELFIYLDQIGLAPRVIYYGAEPKMISTGVEIQRISGCRIKPIERNGKRRCLETKRSRLSGKQQEKMTTLHIE